VPRRIQELPLRRFAVGALFIAFLVCPTALRGQDLQSPAPAAGEVEGFLEVTARLTRVHDQNAPILGLAAFLGLSGGWRAGGAGFFLLDRIGLDIPPPLQDLELNIGYAGLFLQRSFYLSPGSSTRPTLSPRLLIGAGNAEVRDSGTESRLRSDNFLVLEPTLSFEAAMAGRISVGAVAAWRSVVGVEELQNIEERSLEGWSLGLVMRFGPF
jgi:hypothetical protein